MGGLSDLRMGTNDKGKGGNLCTTDGADSIECPGYFGHIELAKPMYHCGFLRTVIRVLRCVRYGITECLMMLDDANNALSPRSYHTSKLLVDKNDARFIQSQRIQDPDKRLRAIVGMCAGKKTDENTGAPQPSYKFEGLKIILEFPKPKNEEDAPDIGELRQELTAAR